MTDTDTTVRVAHHPRGDLLCISHRESQITLTREEALVLLEELNNAIGQMAVTL